MSSTSRTTTTTRPTGNRTPRRLLRAGAVAAGLALALTACSNDSGDAPTSDAAGATTEQTEPVRIGVVGASDDQWRIFEEKAEAAGIPVEIIDFTEYSLPNPALTEGELDLNQFQHILYLAQYNVEAGEDLVPIGATAVYPLGLYSREYDDVADIPEGAEIAVPNDPTNLARALLVLQDAGLVTLRDGGSAFSTEADILADESRVKVTPVDAQQTALALDSVAASIINNDFLADAGIDPDSVLFADDASSPAARPYINIWVARAEDAENPTYLKLVEIYKDQEVQDAVLAASGGTGVLANQTPAELAEILAEVEEDARNR